MKAFTKSNRLEVIWILQYSMGLVRFFPLPINGYACNRDGYKLVKMKATLLQKKNTATDQEGIKRFNWDLLKINIKIRSVFLNHASLLHQIYM